MRLWTVRAGLGAVSVASRPLGDELLIEELQELRDEGVTVLVSMLDQDELPILGLEYEELAAPFVGLRYFHLQTSDMEPPPSDAGTLSLLAHLASQARGGGHIAVHCAAGQGRSPAFACAILVMAGQSADDAMRDLSLARGRTVPHRESQRDWVRWVEQQVLQV